MNGYTLYYQNDEGEYIPRRWFAYQSEAERHLERFPALFGWKIEPATVEEMRNASGGHIVGVDRRSGY